MKKYRILIICIVILIVCCVFAQKPIQPIMNFFLDLEDTPLDYTGDDGKVVKVDETNNQLIFEAESGAVEDDVYGAGWNGDTANAPSQNATYDILHQYDTDDDGDIDNIDGAVGGGDITGVGPGGLAAGDAWTDGYTTVGTTLLIWEGTTVDAAEFSIVVPEDPGADIVITMPTATATLNAASDITGTDAGTDLTADLEEEVTEGSLADSTIISADIKNGEVALVDLAAAAYAKDIVTTSPITGGTNNVLVGADSDVTIAIGDADDDGATKGAASFDNTDFDAVAGNVTINDDGHAHTGTSISGVDISADTNLAVGTGITLTDDTLTATEEDIEDFMGGMLGGTETHIAVTYQDASNDIDFVIDPDSVAGSISAGAYNDDSVNDDDINWANLTYLTTDGAGINEAYAAGWNADVGPPEKDDVYDYLHLMDTDDDGDVDNIDGSIAALLYETELDNFSELDTQIADKALVNKADGAVWSGVHDYGGATTFEIPNAESADGTLGILGQIHIRGDEDRFSAHVGAGGEIAGEVTKSFLYYVSARFDPGLWYDSDAEVFLFTVKSDMFPNGIIIDEWSVSCNVDPDVEMNADLRYADAYIGLANAADIDEIDTTNGTSSEDTDANINGGAAVAVGKVVYIGFDGDPEGTATQMIFEMWFHAEED